MPTGYSGTPLAKKLGLKPGLRAWFLDMPPSVRAEIDPDAIGLAEQTAPSAGMEAVHIFVSRRDDLAHHIAAIRDLLAPAGFIWVSWPKKAAKTDTDITENTVSGSRAADRTRRHQGLRGRRKMVRIETGDSEEPEEAVDRRPRRR